MKERTDELYGKGVFALYDVEEWDEKIQDTTNDCLDRFKEYVESIVESLEHEKSNKLTKRPGSNQCKGKYYDGETTWGELYEDNYSYLEYCVNRNNLYHLNYGI